MWGKQQSIIFLMYNQITKAVYSVSRKRLPSPSSSLHYSNRISVYLFQLAICYTVTTVQKTSCSLENTASKNIRYLQNIQIGHLHINKWTFTQMLAFNIRT